MKGKKVFVFIVILLLLGAGAWYFLKGNFNGEKGASKYSLKNPFVGSLKAAISLGIPMKCTYEANGVEYSGVIKGKQYRGEIDMPEGGKGHILMRENCLYSWADGESQGTKMCFEDQDESFWEGAGENMPSEYKCYPTMISPNEFSLPSGVDFMDLDSLMNQGGL